MNKKEEKKQYVHVSINLISWWKKMLKYLFNSLIGHSYNYNCIFYICYSFEYTYIVCKSDFGWINICTCWLLTRSIYTKLNIQLPFLKKKKKFCSLKIFCLLKMDFPNIIQIIRNVLLSFEYISDNSATRHLLWSFIRACTSIVILRLFVLVISIPC